MLKNIQSAAISSWEEAEKLYQLGNAPFCQVELSSDPMDSTYPNPFIVFTENLFDVGQIVCVGKSATELPLFGVVTGLSFDGEEWKYEIFGSLAMPFDAKESELSPCLADADASLFVYQDKGLWVFDDPAVELTKEPFVRGIDEMIDRLTILIPDADKGFILKFSSQPFVNYRTCLNHDNSEDGGNWYYSPQFDMTGWLCPALYKYFSVAPDTLYVKAEPREGDLLLKG